MVGYSDLSILITPLTLVAGWATLHGNNLMDTPYRPPEGLLSWLDIVPLPPNATFAQSSPGRYRLGYVDYVDHPGDDEFVLDRAGRWQRLDVPGREPGAALDVTGRLIGGCVETLANLAGTRYLDTTQLQRAAGDHPVAVLTGTAH